MKKLFLLLLSFYLLTNFVNSQTVSEITNILNTKPQLVTVTNATANNSNLISVDLSTSGYKVIQITITGTWSATVSFQASADNFTTIDAIPAYQTTAGTWGTSTTSNGTFSIPCYGYRYIRVRTTAFSSGTVAGTAYAKLNNADIPDYNTGTTTVSGTVTVQQSTASNLKVDLSGTAANATAIKVDGSAVTQPVSISGNQAVNLAQIAGATASTGNGVAGTGVQRVTIASDNTAFTVNAAQSGTWTVQPGNTANTTPWLVTQIPATSGGLSVDSRTALTGTVVSAKASAGQLFGYYWYNPNASATYIQVFNTASGSVTLGTTTPVYVITIPATSGANVEFTNGIAHSTAITYAATTTATGSTAPSSSLTGFMLYK